MSQLPKKWPSLFGQPRATAAASSTARSGSGARRTSRPVLFHEATSVTTNIKMDEQNVAKHNHAKR